MNIDKLERANILAKILIPEADALLYVAIDILMNVSGNVSMTYRNVTKSLILNLRKF